MAGLVDGKLVVSNIKLDKIGRMRSAFIIRVRRCFMRVARVIRVVRGGSWSLMSL
jgi:hypothetical protein